MKYLLVIMSLFLTIAVHAQDRASKFHVDSSDMRIKKNGKWSQWYKRNDTEEGLDCNFFLNLSQKVVIWDSKYKDQPRKVFTYPIVSEVQDTTYDNFNFWALILKTKDRRGRISVMTLSINTVNESTAYMIICRS